MTADDAWFKVYDVGVEYGIDSLTSEQRQLFFYIDFSYYVDNGGASGFLYNKSPSEVGDNYYLPYIESWRFFQINDLANLIEEYNAKFSNALKDLKKGETMTNEEFTRRFGLNDIEQEIETKITEITRENSIVYNWIEKNLDLLGPGLEKSTIT